MEWTSLPTPFITAQRLSELPLPCVTMCHHISAGPYRSLSAQRLPERTVEEKSTRRMCEDNIKMANALGVVGLDSCAS